MHYYYSKMPKTRKQKQNKKTRRGKKRHVRRTMKNGGELENKMATGLVNSYTNQAIANIIQKPISQTTITTPIEQNAPTEQNAQIEEDKCLKIYNILKENQAILNEITNGYMPQIVKNIWMLHKMYYDIYEIYYGVKSQFNKKGFYDDLPQELFKKGGASNYNCENLLSIIRSGLNSLSEYGIFNNGIQKRMTTKELDEKLGEKQSSIKYGVSEFKRFINAYETSNKQ